MSSSYREKNGVTVFQLYFWGGAKGIGKNMQSKNTKMRIDELNQCTCLEYPVNPTSSVSLIDLYKSDGTMGFCIKPNG
jgi:hypothetical protein